MNDIPVILVCYNRPWHTAQVLKALLEHDVRNLYIFSDGPRTDRDIDGVRTTRKLFATVRWTRPEIIERSENMGLARSVVSAANYVFEKHDRLILLEDDCVPGKYFFDYMQACLSKYRDSEKVFGINGYTVPIPEGLLKDYPYDVYFYPRIGSWGWATWKRAWKHYDPDLSRLYNQVTANGIDITQGGADIPAAVRALLSGQLKDVWTLNWVLSVYLKGGCYVYPTTPHIQNVGLDGTGVHCGTARHVDNPCPAREPRRFPDTIILNKALIGNYNSYFGGPAKSAKVVQGPGAKVLRGAAADRQECESGNRTGRKRLSIVHVNTHDFAGGAAKVAWRLAEAQRGAGHDSKMVVGEKTTNSPHSFSFPIETDRSLRSRCVREGRLYYEHHGSHKLIYNPLLRSAHIVHLHNLHGGYFNPFSISALSHLKPTVWTLHDMQAITGHCAHSFDCQRWENGCGQCPYPGIYPDIRVDTSEQLCRDKQQIYDNSYLTIVTPSRWLKDKVERSILRNHPVELIYNGVDTDVFKPYDKRRSREKFGVPADALVIGAVAHFGALKNSWKGGNYTRSALNALRNKLDDFVFVNIGGECRTDDPRIMNIPLITDENELAQAYSALDIFLYTPVADNCPLVVLEALSCGIPIVTFDTGGVPELVRDGVDGLVTAYTDVAAVTAALKRLTADPDMRAECGRNARLRATAEFDHKVIAARYQRLYESCLHQRAREPLKVRLFPVGEIPEVVLSDVFLKAEDFKKSLTPGTPKEQDAQAKPDSPGRRNVGPTVATSIGPKGIARQAAAIQTWQKLGFHVVSLNCAKEIATLHRSFPGVEFVRTARDAGEKFGRPLVYFDDVMDYLRACDSQLCGIINSDIFVVGDEAVTRFIQEQAAGSLVYGSRTDVDSLAVLNGRVYHEGFDFFFFDRSIIPHLPESDFCIGLPWWDYWLPLIMTMEGVPMKRFVAPFAYHLRHGAKWSGEHWTYLGWRFLNYLLSNISRNFHEDPDTNLWASLGRLMSAYHDEELRLSHRKNTDKISGGALCRCVLDFLASNTQRIYHGRDDLPVGRPTIAAAGKRDDLPQQSNRPSAAQQNGSAEEYDASVIVCTKDRAGLLDRMLGSLKEATKGISCEVIAVEGGSGDGTQGVLHKHGVTRIYSEAECLGEGRHSWPRLYNFGFRKAKGRYAMYASDDVVFGKGAVSQAVRTLNGQADSVAGGIFFYRNIRAVDPGWEKYGIDFTYGCKLLMNYGLFRLDCFREVGGLDESYEFYCADSDFCYKLYERGRQLIPLPACLVTHNNVLDAQKMANMAASNRDIELLLRRWSRLVSPEIPNPRRLIWDEGILAPLDLPNQLERVDSSIESFWHGLACFQHGLFKEAQGAFIQALRSGCDHWQVLRYLAKASQMGGDEVTAQWAGGYLSKPMPGFTRAGDSVEQYDGENRAAIPPRAPATVRSLTEKAAAGPAGGLVGLIFSKNRAMQLQATLKSLMLRCRDINDADLYVLYKVTNELHRRQYGRLRERFCNVNFIEETQFKEQVLTVAGRYEYVMFMVDDNLFVRDFSLSDVVEALRRNSDALGFSLRLGTNTDYCYSLDACQRPPEFEQAGDGIVKYNWTRAENDYGYPLEVSSSVYAATDVMALSSRLEFENPNTLEASMAANAGLYARAKGSLLCYERSVTFCNPVNMVQSVCPNRVGRNSEYSADTLAQIFERGGRIDVDRYNGFVPNSCHQEVVLQIVDSLPNAAATSAAAGPPIENSRRPQDAEPKFSIVMANYNNARYVAQAIESVCKQTFEDWELIIVEDCSTDNSADVISPYLSDNRIRLVRHGQNRGYTAALKTGIANVRSEDFGILDSDDCLKTEAVEKMYRWHIERPDCGFVYSQFVYCDENLAETRIGFCREIPAGKTSLDAGVVSHFKTFKLRDYLKTSGYDENILYAEDIDIVYKMEEVTRLKFVDECLYLYRQAPASLSRSKDKINIAIMSRVKARINALRRRCSALAEATEGSFDELFREAVDNAKREYEDVAQYLVILKDLYKRGMLDGLNLPAEISRLQIEEAVLWLAANVSLRFDRLFEFLQEQNNIGGRSSTVSEGGARCDMVRYAEHRRWHGDYDKPGPSRMNGRGAACPSGKIL
ncbi:MAG: glycosyltransferase [Phycisphaerales bacterium]|nr:MAG: glycosyltransferase [Phycisphaerales bacterium]